MMVQIGGGLILLLQVHLPRPHQRRLHLVRQVRHHQAQVQHQQARVLPAHQVLPPAHQVQRQVLVVRQVRQFNI